jgi:methyl-accepting chemotaxis protein
VHLAVIPMPRKECDVMRMGQGLVRRFSNLSIAKKLSSCFALLVVGLVVVVVVGSSGMSSMVAVHGDVVNVGEAKQLAAQDARSAASDMHFSQTLYVLGGVTHHANFLADRQTFQVTLNHLVVVSKDAADKPLVAAIQAATTRFDSGDASLWSLVRAGRSTDAVKLVQGAQNDAADALTAALAAYQKSSAADVTAQTALFHSTASSSKLMMILVGAVAILLGLLAGFLLTRSIAGRIKKMMLAADGIADGDVNQQIDSTCKDELGATAAAFHRMIDYLKTMAGAAELIADGNLSVEVHPRSAHDALGNAFAAMIANLRDLVGKLSQAAGSVGTASQRSRSARPR